MRKGLVYLFVLITLNLSAQTLQVQQEGSKLYLNHTVAAKENWYSIGRTYNISPRDIAPFNNASIDKGLSIGQKLKVPLTEVNLAQGGQPAPDEVFVPVYHTVKEKEGLYRIGQNYNKVSVDQLKAWNKLKSDETSKGMNLVVGYLRVKRELSSLASGGVTKVASQPVAKTVAPAPTPVTTAPEPKTPPPPVKTTTPPVTPPANTTAVNTAPKKETQPPPAKTTAEPVAAPSKPIPSAPGTEGAFAGLYTDQSKGNPSNSITGQAASFKSTSGWKDGKYYVLMNNVPPGTIVKITTPANNKHVYAKVLGEIPAGKENEGLLVRLSNAALAQLQMPEGKFDVQLEY
jgi:LysM repeat protein